MLEYCLTPCAWSARSMGFLRSSIQVRARYHRCKFDWSDHLEETRALILRAARLAPRRRRAVVFGAGLLHDIPLRDLAEMFEQVVLVDMVHTWPCRMTAFGFPNVKLQQLDVTGVVSQLRKARRNPLLPLPESRPLEFMDDPFLDFTVSVNIASQLGWVPSLFLQASRSVTEIAAFKSQLIFAHLEYLRKLPGHTALISDTAWRSVPLRKNSIEDEEVWDVLSGISLPEPVRSWDWRIAPAPERSRDADFVARVYAYPDWKSASMSGSHGVCFGEIPTER